MTDSIQLAITSRNFTKEEFENLKARNYLPVAIPLAYDGLSLIINRENTDSCITVKDIKRVLNGQAKTWSDIVPGSKRGDILVVLTTKSQVRFIFV